MRGFQEHLYNIWFLSSNNSELSSGHKAVVYGIVVAAVPPLDDTVAQNVSRGTREQNQVWAEKSWFEETRC